FFPDRIDRRYSPGWNCEEERDHDDRLCPGRGTPAAFDGGAIDLRSLPDAFSSHHDDDDGGFARQPSIGAWSGSRFGAAPPARHRDRRRPFAVAVPDAVHDPGHLHLSEQADAPIAW